jgi:AraC family ethanolamine operon transcriptional activator
LGADALRFDDVEDQASALAGWNQEYLQLSQGAFEGDICQVHGAGVRVFVERVQQSVFQTGVLRRGVLAVGVALDASGEGMFCGQACGADAFHVFSGASGFEFRTSRQHTMLGVELQIDHDLINAASGDHSPKGGAAQAGIMRMNPQTVAEIRNYLWALLQSARSDATLLGNAAVGATVADFLLDRMASKHHDGELWAVGGRCSHWGLVRQACAMMRDSLDEVPTVARLCADLDVSRRTLQYGFARVLGVNPLAYLKAVRLQQARRALKEAKSVTEAATGNGFWHFGHFSQDYQAMFGELPSATLRRVRAGL